MFLELVHPCKLFLNGFSLAHIGALEYASQFYISCDNMPLRTNLDDKMEWMDKVILEENDLAKFIKEYVPKPEPTKAKEKKTKDLIRDKRIISYSSKDHLILQVSSKETPKEMFDALSRMYEGRNTNRKMNLRRKFKSIKMSKGESIQEYFTRVYQLKEQI